MWPGGSRQHPTGGKYSRSGWVSLAGRGVEEVRSPGRGARTGVRWEIKTHCRTGKDGKVKLGSREALAVTWLEMEARSLDGWDSPAAGLKRQVFWLGGSGQKRWFAVSEEGASPSVWFGQVRKSQESSHRVYEREFGGLIWCGTGPFGCSFEKLLKTIYLRFGFGVLVRPFWAADVAAPMRKEWLEKFVAEIPADSRTDLSCFWNQVRLTGFTAWSKNKGSRGDLAWEILRRRYSQTAW